MWPSGNEYQGEYKDDERHGYGEMRWKDGSLYKGEWVKGVQQGMGEMRFADGRVKRGYFENNVLVRETVDEDVNGEEQRW